MNPNRPFVLSLRGNYLSDEGMTSTAGEQATEAVRSSTATGSAREAMSWGRRI